MVTDLATCMALQEYYIRHLDDSAAGSSGEDHDRLRRGLEAAIQRRYTEVTTAASVHLHPFIIIILTNAELECMRSSDPDPIRGFVWSCAARTASGCCPT